MSQNRNRMISRTDLEEISQRSKSLSERLSQQVEVESETQQQDIDKRLDRWCQIVAEGDWEKFKKGLYWDGLDIKQIRPLLADDYPTTQTQLPPWTDTLIALGEATELLGNQTLKMPIEPEDPLPFEEVFLPAIVVARQKLSHRLGISALKYDQFPLTIISQDAYLSLERILLERLVILSEKTLYFEFCKFRPSTYNGINLLLEKLDLLTQLGTSDPEKKYYNAFVEKLWQDGFLTLWKNYPVLARLITTTLDFWVEATAEFTLRFQVDSPEIASRLGLCAPGAQISQEELRNLLGQIVEITGDSDFHNEGRSVLILTFKSGQKLVYKPKNLGIEVAYNQLLEWCNQQQCPLPFKVLNHYNRGTYGWVLDYVEQQPCVDRASTHRFYQQGGMLLCLLYVLGANDCHYENVIAHRSELVLVDLETIMHPRAQAIAHSPQGIQEILTGAQNWDSVLRTGLLPRWDFSPDNLIAYDTALCR